MIYDFPFCTLVRRASWIASEIPACAPVALGHVGALFLPAGKVTGQPPARSQESCHDVNIILDRLLLHGRNRTKERRLTLKSL